MGSSRFRVPFALALVAWIGGSVGGCAWSVEAEKADPPPPGIKTVVVGPMTMDDTDREREVRLFRRNLVMALEGSKVFERVLSIAPEPLPADAIVITGRFRKISDGDEALRFLVGYVAGAPRLRADFVVADAAGQPLAAFREDHRSPDGTGWKGHFEAVDMDALATDFAVWTAAVIIRWTQGEPIEPDVWESVEEYVGL